MRHAGGSKTITVRNSIADVAASLLVRVGAPLLRRVGVNPAHYPRYLKQADRSGVHLRTTHYYQPVYADADLPSDVTTERSLPGVDLNVAGQLALLARFDSRAELERIASEAPGEVDFRHGNGMYEYGDAESLFSMLRHLKPRRVIEIGSGHSTRMACAALRQNRADDARYVCDHICIEPYEMPWLERLDVEVIRKRVQDVEPAMFAQLEAGDVLFIDSSHVIRPYGDVLREYQEIIPSLAKGVVVHVHDIFTPREYPEAWLRAERRLWNEQYLLEVMIAHSGRYAVTLAMNYLKHHHHEELARVFPATGREPAHEPGAFWFEVIG